jgi:glycosyltransferase involved in cell wall biosynthesis
VRIGVDLASWANRRGYGRFTRGLLGALVELDRRHEYVLFADAQTMAEHRLPPAARLVAVGTDEPPVRAASAASRRSLRDVLRMTRAVARERVDVFFFPTVYTFFPLLGRARVVVGIHDTIAEDHMDLVFPGGKGAALWRLKSALARRQADYILTVSEHARRAIVRRFGWRRDRIWVIGEAPDAVFRRTGPTPGGAALRARLDISPQERLLVYVGGINPHKNLEALARAFSRLRADPALGPLRLVLVGDLDDLFTPGLARLADALAALDLHDTVTFTGFLADEELVHLLNMATLAVLPSVAEGFGLPAVEAAACGLPVVATRNSPLPELLAGGGIFVDPTDLDELTEALRTLLSDEEMRGHMGDTACRQASRLSWDRSAREMRALFDSLADG